MPQAKEQSASKTKKCAYCAEEILEEAKKCKHCGEFLDEKLKASSQRSAKREKSWDPGIAAALSFILPGMGQIYKGDIGIGLVLLLFTIIGYAMFIIPGLGLHIFAIYSAYSAPAPKR